MVSKTSRRRRGEEGLLGALFQVAAGLGKILLDVLDALGVGVVGAQELGGRVLAAGLGHAAPEADGGAGLVAGLGHQDQADAVGLALMGPAEGEEDADGRAGAVGLLRELLRGLGLARHRRAE